MGEAVMGQAITPEYEFLKRYRVPSLICIQTLDDPRDVFASWILDNDFLLQNPAPICSVCKFKLVLWYRPHPDNVMQCVKAFMKCQAINSHYHQIDWHLPKLLSDGTTCSYTYITAKGRRIRPNEGF